MIVQMELLMKNGGITQFCYGWTNTPSMYVELFIMNIVT